MALTVFKPNIDKLFNDMIYKGIHNLDLLGDNNGIIFFFNLKHIKLQFIT